MRRYIRRPVCFALAFVLAFANAAFGWWETGHRVVARVAAAHLTPAARTRIARILEVADTPQAVADALAQASTWADETKAQTKTGDWHFIDLALQDKKSDIRERCPHDNCAPARIEIFEHDLRTHTPQQRDQRWSELDQLRYLVHLVGDLHQPMHTVSDADLGGNCEQLATPIDNAKNLHALWDGAIVAEMNVSDKDLAANLQTSILSMAEAEREAITSGTVDDWAWESHELALRNIYYKLHVPVEPPVFPKTCADAPEAITNFHPEIDALYIDSMKPVVREQLVKAGLRLAKLLNEAL